MAEINTENNIITPIITLLFCLIFNTVGCFHYNVEDLAGYDSTTDDYLDMSERDSENNEGETPDYRYYRIPIIVTSTSGVVIDQQVEVNIDVPSVISHMGRDDAGDIRFFEAEVDDPYSSTEETLPYWVEEFNRAENRLAVWVRIPVILTTETAIHMYYGDPFADSKSDFEEAFPWKSETVDLVNDIQHTCIAVDDNNFPHISYRDIVDDSLKYASWDGSSWQIDTVDSSPDTGYHTSIVLDDNDFTHISYCESGDTKIIRHAQWNGTEWQIDEVESCYNRYGAYTSIDVDSQYDPHISYYCTPESTTERHLHYSKREGVSWDISTVDTETTLVTSLKLDSNDNPHIAYMGGLYDGIFYLKYANWNGESWDITQLDNDVDYVSLDIDSNDYAHIAYYDQNTGVKYKRYNGVDWDWMNIDSIIVESYFLSICLNSRDYPHISYQDQYEPDYYISAYAKWNGSNWDLGIVDAERGAGNDSSLVLDSHDFPHISYETEEVGLKYTCRHKYFSLEPSVSIREEIPIE